MNHIQPNGVFNCYEFAESDGKETIYRPFAGQTIED